MMLADMGANVLLVDRPDDPRLGFGRDRWFDDDARRRSATLDLKSGSGLQEPALALAGRADALIEGFIPASWSASAWGPRAAEGEPQARLRAVTGWARRPRSRRAPDTTSTTSRSPACCTPSAVPARRCPAQSGRRFGGGGVLLAFGIACGLVEAQRSASRWWTRRWWTAPRCLPRCSPACSPAALEQDARRQRARHRRARYGVRKPGWKIVAISSSETSSMKICFPAWVAGQIFPAMDRGWPALGTASRRNFARKRGSGAQCSTARILFAPVRPSRSARPAGVAHNTFTRSGKVDRRSRRASRARREDPQRRRARRQQALADWGFPRSMH